MISATLTASGNSVPPLGLAEHILDDVALLVEIFVEQQFNRRGASLRDVMAAT